MTPIAPRRTTNPLRRARLADGLLFGGIFCLVALGGAAFGKNPEPANAFAPSPFGVGADNQTSQRLEKWIPQMAAIGLTQMRACRTSFGDVEPKEGEWSWERLDAQLSLAESQHMEFFGLLLGTVQWDTKDRPGSLPVNNLPAWSAYVSEVVKHAKGKIKYWEVWNEPPNFTGRDQTPADYAKIVVSAYDAAKAADPGCLVGLAAKSVHVNYLEQVIKAGAKGHFDYVTLHPYEVLDGIADNAGTEAVYLNIVPTVRKMLAAQDPAKVNVPILFTELGADAKKGAERQADALVKAYSMAIAEGVSSVEWFEGMDGDSGPMGLMDAKGNPRPSYVAMSQMIEHFGPHPAYLGWLLLDGKDYGFVFRGAKSTVLAAWAHKGPPDHVVFGRAVQIVDPVAGKAVTADAWDLTTAPILALDPPASLLSQAAANKNQPLPWGGNYANAKSVSVTMGERNTEKGLHTMSGDTIAAAVVDYGGSARAGDVPGGNVFIVDPTFLCYTPVPIEISVVVRRNPSNDNAGFKLVYEAVDGFKNCGWYTVPDNKEWHTMKWKIDDAQFVNTWGYSFSLNSDGNQYNKYYIQSVTVTKLEK